MSDGRDGQVDESQDGTDERSVTRSTTDTGAESDDEVRAKPAAEAGDESDTETGTESEVETGIEPDTETRTESEVEAESDSDSETRSEASTDSSGTTPAITRRSEDAESARSRSEGPKPAIRRRDDTDSEAPDSRDQPAVRDHHDQLSVRGHHDQPSVGTHPSGTGRLEPEDILEYTTDRRSLASHVKLQWGLWTTVSVVILTAILTTLLANFGVDPRVGALVLVVLFFLGMGWVGLRYRRWVYQVREDALYLERGVVTHVRTLVPYVRIQHVDTSRGPLERTLGLSTLVVYTAGSRGADVSIPGLTPDEARDLQQRVKELAIEAEGDDAV